MSEAKDAQMSQDNNVEMNADFNPNTQESGLDWWGFCLTLDLFDVEGCLIQVRIFQFFLYFTFVSVCRLLDVTSDKFKSRKIQDPFPLSQGNDNVDDELLQLCSGTFTDCKIYLLNFSQIKSLVNILLSIFLLIDFIFSTLSSTKYNNLINCILFYSHNSIVICLWQGRPSGNCHADCSIKISN